MLHKAFGIAWYRRVAAGGSQKNAKRSFLTVDTISVLYYRELFDHLPMILSTFDQSSFSNTWTAPTGPSETSFIYKTISRKMLLLVRSGNVVVKRSQYIQKNLRRYS